MVTAAGYDLVRIPKLLTATRPQWGTENTAPGNKPSLTPSLTGPKAQITPRIPPSERFFSSLPGRKRPPKPTAGPV